MLKGEKNKASEKSQTILWNMKIRQMVLIFCFVLFFLSFMYVKFCEFFGGFSFFSVFYYFL